MENTDSIDNYKFFPQHKWCCNSDAKEVYNTSYDTYLEYNERQKGFYYKKLEIKYSFEELTRIREDLLPEDLKKIDWIIYETDWDFLINPYYVEKISKILGIEVKAKDIFGEKGMAYLEERFTKDDLQSIFLRINKQVFEDYDKLYLSNLKNQQKEFLRYRYHFVTGVDVDLLITNVPVDHITAQLLYDYHAYFEAFYEKKIKGERFIHIYDIYHEGLFEKLHSDEFIKNQRELRIKPF